MCCYMLRSFRGSILNPGFSTQLQSSLNRSFSSCSETNFQNIYKDSFEENVLNYSFSSHLQASLNIPFSSSSEPNFQTVYKDNKIVRYVCNICQKSFAQRGNMTIHMRIHTGFDVLTELCDPDRNAYFCRICSFARPSLSSLRKHMQTHSIGRPYSCKEELE
ncbi:Zinc finger protein 470 like protein [Argiope bruennichi]|uniref:Zinc finger protein 470 like protein n=1 Tax=Argiope bruennichi TaxID=94029 RepID=A0A8T0FDP0_ARGBR|nr:Zinc finger protein 470 like protein [Argiope bruennichi]